MVFCAGWRGRAAQWRASKAAAGSGGTPQPPSGTRAALPGELRACHRQGPAAPCSGTTLEHSRGSTGCRSAVAFISRGHAAPTRSRPAGAHQLPPCGQQQGQGRGAPHRRPRRQHSPACWGCDLPAGAGGRCGPPGDSHVRWSRAGNRAGGAQQSSTCAIAPPCSQC